MEVDFGTGGEGGGAVEMELDLDEEAGEDYGGRSDCGRVKQLYSCFMNWIPVAQTVA